MEDRATTAPQIRRDLIVTAALLLALLAWDALGLDLAIERWFGSAHGFAWRDSFFTSAILHDGARWVGLLVFMALIVNVWRPLPGLGGENAMPLRQRWWWLLVTLLCLLLIPLLKRSSLSSCPWDLQEFGGMAHYVGHWRWGIADGGPGRCFPSGHASTAFAFIGGYFVLREQHARVAANFLVIACVVGALLGMAQMVRGAHYVSHTLWTAWICWSSALLLYHVQRHLIRPASSVSVTAVP